jgi:DoxX-like family
MEELMEAVVEAGAGSRKMVWAGRILSALPVLLMVGTGLFGLLKPEAMAPQFAHYGYPDGSLARIVIVEIVCAVLYAIPRTSALGAILLTGYLGGATATHVRAGEPFFIPIVVGIVVWLGLYLRDGRVRALVPLRK